MNIKLYLSDSTFLIENVAIIREIDGTINIATWDNDEYNLSTDFNEPVTEFAVVGIPTVQEAHG